MAVTGDVVVSVASDAWATWVTAAATVAAVFIGAAAALWNERKRRAEERWLAWADELSSIVISELFDAIGPWMEANFELLDWASEHAVTAPQDEPAEIRQKRKDAYRRLAKTTMRFTLLATRLVRRGGEPKGIDLEALAAANDVWKVAVMAAFQNEFGTPGEDPHTSVVQPRSRDELDGLVKGMRNAAMGVSVIAEPALKEILTVTAEDPEA